MLYSEVWMDVTRMLPEYVTAHCISNDCAMGAGVVLAFRKVFPDLKEACKKYMSNPDPIWDIWQEIMIPKPYRYEDEHIGVVYNMFTKDKYWMKAGKGITYNHYLYNLRTSLYYVKEMMIEHSETKLAMPKIGCGLDKCEWDDVRNTIYKVFDDTNFEIVICKY